MAALRAASYKSVTPVLLAVFPPPGLMLLASVSGSSWSLILLEKRVCVTPAVLQSGGAFLLGVGVGGGQFVRVAAFCGCFQPAATCFGGKRLHF